MTRKVEIYKVRLTVNVPEYALQKGDVITRVGPGERDGMHSCETPKGKKLMLTDREITRL